MTLFTVKTLNDIFKLILSLNIVTDKQANGRNLYIKNKPRKNTINSHMPINYNYLKVINETITIKTNLIIEIKKIMFIVSRHLACV